MGGGTDHVDTDACGPRRRVGRPAGQRRRRAAGRAGDPRVGHVAPTRLDLLVSPAGQAAGRLLPGVARGAGLRRTVDRVSSAAGRSGPAVGLAGRRLSRVGATIRRRDLHLLPPEPAADGAARPAGRHPGRRGDQRRLSGLAARRPAPPAGRPRGARRTGPGGRGRRRGCRPATTAGSRCVRHYRRSRPDVAGRRLRRGASRRLGAARAARRRSTPAAIVAELIRRGALVVVTGRRPNASSARGRRDRRRRRSSTWRAGPPCPSWPPSSPARTVWSSGNTGPAHLAAAVRNAGGLPVLAGGPGTSAGRPTGCPPVVLGDQHEACRDSRARECPLPGTPVPRHGSARGGADAVDHLASIAPAVVPRQCRRWCRHEDPVWHVHGSWMTSFVPGPHDYLRAGAARTADRTAAAGPAPGSGRDAVREATPHELRGRRRSTSSCCSAPSETRAAAAMDRARPGIDLPAVYVEHNAPPATPAAACTRSRTATTSRSCTSPASTR